MALDRIDAQRAQELADEIEATLLALDGSQGEAFGHRLMVAGELLYVRGEEIVFALRLAAKAAPLPNTRSENTGGRDGPQA